MQTSSILFLSLNPYNEVVEEDEQNWSLKRSVPFGSLPIRLNSIIVNYITICVALLARNTAWHNSIILVVMQSAISVTITHQNEALFSSTIMAQSMKDEGYEQPSLQTDTEPLPKLKEGELLYLSAAIEVWMGIAP